MFIKQIQLTNFRNISYLNIDNLAYNRVILYGHNGAGKTNFLEALSLLCIGRGLHKTPFPDLCQKSFSEFGIFSKVINNSNEVDYNEIGMHFTKSKKNRVIKIDGEIQNKQEKLSKISKVLWFTPKMDRLFIDSAQPRRDFIDRLTFNLIPEHAVSLLSYKKHLKNRLTLLKNNQDTAWILEEEKQAAYFGAMVIKNRAYMLKKLSSHLKFTELYFKGGFSEKQAEDIAILAEEIQHTLCADRDRDKILSKTHCGPQKVDIKGSMLLNIKNKDNIFDKVELSVTSTGQHKRALVDVILASANMLYQETGVAPIILLDEFTSHIDNFTKKELFDNMEKIGTQLFLTGTEKQLFEYLESDKNTLFINVQNGDFIIEN